MIYKVKTKDNNYLTFTMLDDNKIEVSGYNSYTKLYADPKGKITGVDLPGGIYLYLGFDILSIVLDEKSFLEANEKMFISKISIDIVSVILEYTIVKIKK